MRGEDKVKDRGDNYTFDIERASIDYWTFKCKQFNYDINDNSTLIISFIGDNDVVVWG